MWVEREEEREIRMPEEWGGIIPSPVFLDEARRIVEEGKKEGLSTAASERQIYFHPQGWFFIDVFFDKLLVANHPLDFRGRLELDFPTLTPTDLLLEKLQIVNFSEKDMKDTLVLLLAHQMGEEDGAGLINARYIAGLLARDWGFWYTVTTNLKGVKELLPEMDLPQEEKGVIAQRVDRLIDRIEEEPKSLRWKTRARIGPKMRWYEPVETMETVGEFGIWRLAEQRKKVK